MFTYFYLCISGTVESMTQPVWCTVTRPRSGFVMAEEILQEGNSLYTTP